MIQVTKIAAALHDATAELIALRLAEELANDFRNDQRNGNRENDRHQGARGIVAFIGDRDRDTNFAALTEVNLLRLLIAISS